MAVVLDVQSLGISFGGLRAVDNFNVQIEKNELYGLIGPNGAGKTTIFNLLTGVYKPTDGQIILDGENITGLHCIDINKRESPVRSKIFGFFRIFLSLIMLRPDFITTMSIPQRVVFSVRLNSGRWKQT